VNEKQMNDVLDAIEQEARGRQVLAGGERIDDESYLVAPTLFEGVADDAMLSCEEVFGPRHVALDPTRSTRRSSVRTRSSSGCRRPSSRTASRQRRNS
jgi:hypothetical protein